MISFYKKWCSVLDWIKDNHPHIYSIWINLLSSLFWILLVSFTWILYFYSWQILAFILNLQTRWIKVFSDYLYSRIALGDYNFLISTHIFMILIIFLEVLLLLTLKRFRKQLSLEEEDTDSFIERFFWKILNTNKRKYNFISITLLLIFCFQFIPVSVYTLQYSLVSWFDTSIRIIEPYIEQKEVLALKSEFAQIRNKDDYLVIINRLKVIAEKNKLRLPKTINIK